jgi:hypothetical protein
MDPYLISFAWRKRCTEIAGWHPGLLDAVYQTCQISSFDHAMAVYSLSRAEIKRINLIARRVSHSAVLAPNASPQAEPLKAAKPDMQSRRADNEDAFLAKSILVDTRSNLEVAIWDLETEGWWRYGRFTRKELQKNLKKRSDYGWMYHHLSAMTSDQVNNCYGRHGQRFLNACDYTFLIRDQNVMEFLDQNIGYAQDTSSTITNPVRKTQVRRDYLSIPGITPVDAAKRVVTFVSNLRRRDGPDKWCRSYEFGGRASDRSHRDSKRPERPSSFQRLRCDL